MVRLSGNWYTDPCAEGYSWQDYERLYKQQIKEEELENSEKGVNMARLNVNGVRVIKKGNKIIEDRIHDSIELKGLLVGDNGAKRNQIENCILYRENETECKNIEKVYIDSIVISPKDNILYNDGYEMVVGDAYFDITTIYRFGIKYTSGEYCIVEFDGRIDNDSSYEKDLSIIYHYDNNFDHLARDAKCSLIKKSMPLNEEKLDKIIEIINE